MCNLVDVLKNGYSKAIPKDIRTASVVYKGESPDSGKMWKIQIMDKNGNKTILDALSKYGQTYFKEADIQEELKNVRLIKRYDLSDSASVKKDLKEVSDGLESVLAKMETSRDGTEISELRDLQNGLFKYGKFDDISCKKIILLMTL